MYEYTCPVCGVTKKVRYEWEVRTFCGVRCAGIYREQKKERKREAEVYSGCVFQPESVACADRNCTNCGWNPVVAKARLDAIMNTGISEPPGVDDGSTV